MRTIPHESNADLRFSDAWRLDGKLEDCGEAQSCEVQKLTTLGGSQWFFRRGRWGDDEIPDEMFWGELIEKRPNGEYWAAWSLSGEGALAVLEPAAILRFENETYLLVPIIYKGNGALREDQLFHWKADHWQQVDTGSWRSELALPDCYQVRKGVDVDFEKLAYERDLFFDLGRDVGATEGKLEVKFKLRGDRLEIDSWQVAEDEDAVAEPTAKLIRCGSKLGRCPPCQPRPAASPN